MSAATAIVVAILAFIGAVVVGCLALLAIEWCMKYGPTFCRMWSPWRLRRELALIKGCLNDDRGMWDNDGFATSTERNYRHASAALDGDPNPGAYAEKFTIRGGAIVYSTRTEQ